MVRPHYALKSCSRQHQLQLRLTNYLWPSPLGSIVRSRSNHMAAQREVARCEVLVAAHSDERGHPLFRGLDGPIPILPSFDWAPACGNPILRGSALRALRFLRETSSALHSLFIFSRRIEGGEGRLGVDAVRCRLTRHLAKAAPHYVSSNRATLASVSSWTALVTHHRRCWSAGCQGIRALLRHESAVKRIDRVIMIVGIQH